MLSWALKKGFQGATGLRDAPEGGEDTTRIDVPDTPAPVFAARAIRNAIWGQPETTEGQPAVMKPNNTERVEPASNATAAATAVPTDTRSPTKLNSILLTPGTGTSRRKRVSFGRDVKTNNNVDSSPSSARSDRLRKKAALRQALENSRPKKPQVEKPEEDNSEDEGEWEDEDNCCHHDLTVDLNEPHSESGKYWKAEWSRYREEAKSDIEQLVKYKANAKSYAAKKDMEASRLSQKLKEEQAKVAEMETQIAKMTSSESINNRIDTSPRTEQNILEISRELRKARTELRQLERLRDEVKRLKSNLATSRERVAELEAQVAAEGSSESAQVERLEKQLSEVKEQSRQKDSEIRKLKRDYESLKRDAKSRTAEALQVLQEKNVKIGELEKKLQVMEAAGLPKQSKSLDAAIAEHGRITRDLKADIESLSKPSRHEKARPLNRHMRAVSMEDITFDMTQRSPFKEKDDHVEDGIRRENAHSTGLLTDWTADIPTFDLEGKDKNKQVASEKVDAKPLTMSVSDSSSRRAAKGVGKRSLDVGQRVTSDVLADRVNESTRRRLRRNQLSETNDASTTDRNPVGNGERVRDTRTASLAVDRPRRSRPLSETTHAVSPSKDAPAIDLIQDRFSRLGGPSADRSALGNTSRCTLPAERLAAARARLEQKKRRKASGQSLDKENDRIMGRLGFRLLKVQIVVESRAAFVGNIGLIQWPWLDWNTKITSYFIQSWLIIIIATVITNLECVMKDATMNKAFTDHDDEYQLENEITKLESQLAEAKARLTTKRRAADTDSSSHHTPSTPTPNPTPPIPDSSHHYLLLLSDSALPLGSFAFSSGLESYLAHARSPSSASTLLYKPSFASFLPLSLSSYASTSLPFVLAAHRNPAIIAELDDVLDASIICAVGRRASIAQGRALLSIWEKSLAPSTAVSAEGRGALEAFSATLRRSSALSKQTGSKKTGEVDNAADIADPPPVSAHLAPLFGAVAQLLGLSLRQTAYVFLFSHAKALVSAAVRASMFGPYQAQKILAGGDLQVLIADMIQREWNVPIDEAGQSVPVMDLWIGRHEMLYSRIFNS
ncbi:hypothetical protein FHL15_003003 [Xylaria flabelliformis]|uniref:Spindle pole body-associated protein cut12 domain-containing protein n=1 Tax=Xylaria flabelliformis TaxID=2512241 RepID=A0A553I7U6_9PEZI|nr:hypothetical protein FHL15_003003 [Xylaria flabelliformis]